MAISDYNPFAKRKEFSDRNLTAYKVLTVVSWLLVVVVGIYYSFNAPDDCRRHHHCHTIWDQNDHRLTPFALNSLVVNVYWVILLILQAHYVRYLYHKDAIFVTSSANVGSHFILNNLFTFGFIMCWVRGYFWPGELILVANLFNLTSLYFRHSTTPRFVHIPIVSAPLAWTYVAILWNGAAMVYSRDLPAHIAAYIVIWGILGLGGFYLLAFKDYTMGFELAILSAALALKQMAVQVIKFQFIFAWIIMGLLIILSCLISIPGLFGEKNGIRHEGHIVSQDRERAPLLEDA